MGGARLKLRRGIVEAQALRALAELQAIGVQAEVEANRPPDEAILSLGSLDQFHDGDREPPRPHLAGAVDLAQLSMLDDDEQSAVQPMLSREVDAAQQLGEEGETHREVRTRPAVGEGLARVADVPTSPMQLPPDRSTVVGEAGRVGRNRFVPPEESPGPMELQLDRRPPPRPADDGDDVLGVEGTTSKYVPPAERALMPTVEQPVISGAGAGVRSFLRQQPGWRIGIGAFLGLALGWMMAQPYAGRAERHVAELRAEADKERYRPVDEARARVAALDQRADGEATHGALGSGLIWLLVGGVVFAAWWRFT